MNSKSLVKRHTTAAFRRVTDIKADSQDSIRQGAYELEAPEQLPEFIRVSLGSAIAIGLLEGKLDAAPTTAYLMTHRNGKCTANCGFCPQARQSRSRADILSRVSWPAFPTETVLKALERAVSEGKIRRVCIQALNYPNVVADLVVLTQSIHERTHARISLSCQPLTKENIKRLADTGAERIGISLDAATERLFNKVKETSAVGPYRWDRQFDLLEEAVRVFGKGNVSTHLIVGLGETEQEMTETIQRCIDMGVLPALFAFTPITGTALEHEQAPSLQSYRRVQVARHLIVNGIVRHDNMRFGEDGQILDFGVDEKVVWQVISQGRAFLTSGCPDCNRPYYNEKPRGPLYNYPRILTEEERSQVLKELGVSG